MTKDEELDPTMYSEPKYEKMPPYTPGPNALDLTDNKDCGVLKEIKQIGSGTSKPGPQDRVQVHYVGYFPDGTVFDSSRNRRERFEFTLGRGNVIKAWELGVHSMLRGEVAILYCKPEYAYGEVGHPPKIPPNSTLVFELELFDWKGEDLTENHDGGIIRHQLQKGSGLSSPKEGASVEVHIIGRHNSRIFEDRTVTFILGEGADDGIPEGVEKGIEKFSKGEKSILTIAPQYAFGKEGKPEFSIPSNATVIYEVTLTQFEKTKDSWSLDTKEKVEQAVMFKNKGTDFFKAGKYKLAIKQYKKIIEYIQYETNLEDKDLEKECRQLELAGNLNSALCYLKLEDYTEARNCCDKVIETDPLNEKGLFRRGQAYLGMNDFDLALKDFSSVLNIDSNNKAALNQIAACNCKIKQQKAKDKQIYGNMFAKFAAKDNWRERQRWMNQPDVMENPGTWPTPTQSSQQANDINNESTAIASNTSEDKS